MKISANDIKLGNILDYQGKLWVVIKNPEHTKPGKGGAYVQVEMKALKTGTKLNQRFNSTDTIDKAFLETKEMQYLYIEDENIVVMDQDNFEQLYISKEMIGEKVALLHDGMILAVEFYDDEIIAVKLPAQVTVVVKETDPVIKGATVTSSYKPAIIDSGLKIMVPQYITNGTKIIIKTEDLSFVEKAK